MLLSMRNIFMLYIPPGNNEAMVHYEETIRQRVEPERIYRFTGREVTAKLKSVFQGHRIAVWGSRDGPSNRRNFEAMAEGDEILIIEGDTIKLLGRVAWKEVNPALSRELWKNLRGESSVGWDLIYFIANPREIDVPFSAVQRLFGYKGTFRPRGFTSIARPVLEAFYRKYDDLYSILLRIKRGETVRQIPAEDVKAGVTVAPPIPKQEGESGTDPATVSDHLRMQWMLLSMGRKAGQKVWAPRNDQSRIAATFQFRDFEEHFSAGLNTQVRYVENIDVVWKEEYRIDAAFEIENTTAVYSGLLRFADLTTVAPNTVYPLFIVAPSHRRGQVRDQLNRPIFRHLRLREKVRYLSYERVDEINDFFDRTTRGLSVDVIVGKSELLTEQLG
jgi:hypothetical protein